jgi:mannan endo-1,4-beta-mannosidase
MIPHSAPMQPTAHALLIALSLQLAILSHSAAESRAHPLFGFAIEGLPTQAALKTLKKATGIQAPLVMIYLQWPSKSEGGGFPGETLHAIEASGAVPVLTWEPMFVDPEKDEHAIPAESITAGKYDVYLQRFARESRKFEKPFLIRFAHEMNLARYHWGGTPQEFGPQSAARYRDMFRYVVAVFRAQKADNVRWAFCPNAESVPAERWNQITSYYPGDDVVDVIGIDGYNWGTTQTRAANGWASEWRSFGSIFTGPLQDLKDVASGKPTAVFETSSASEGGNKEEWVLDALDSARSLGLAAVIWFEVNKEIDWRLETNVSEGVRAAINHDNLSISSARSLLSR